MKLAGQRLAAFLQDPGPCRVVLVYGEDAGMIRNRVASLVRAVAGSLDDPFRVVELSRDRLSSLADEAASVPLTGGRRVVRVREVTDTALAAVQAVLGSRAQALVVLEGAGMPARSKLRTLLEAVPDGIAIACYPEEDRVLEGTIRQVLSAASVGVDPDALAWLGGQLGADQASTHAELQKLALYAGPHGHVDVATAMQCVGDAAGLSLDDALFAATVGDVATADRALEVAVAEGASAVGVLRGGLLHLQRLYRARLMVDEGASPADAVRAARPPVFGSRVAPFAKALRLWPSGSLAAAMAGLSQAERNCKRTGAPDYTLCRHAILTLARRAEATQ